MERIFAVYDSDAFYITRFMEYFKKKKDFNFEISVFTKKESLEEFLLLHPVEILLIGEGLSASELPLDKVRYLYVLTETTETVRNTDLLSISKYQSAQSVMNEILSDYNKKENKALPVKGSKSAEIILVYSPLHNPEAVLFTWALSLLIARQKKTFLAMLELFPVKLVAFAENLEANLSEFIYYLKENTNVISKMNALSGYQGNLTYLAGITNAADLLALSKEDMRRWGEEIRNHTDYQTAVFYIGGYSEGIMELMKISDTVLAAGFKTEYEEAVKGVWLQQLEQCGISISDDKFKEIILQKDNQVGQAVTMSELMNTPGWNSALKYLESED